MGLHCGVFAPRYLVEGWVEDAVGDAKLLGRRVLLVLGGGFRLVPRLLGDRVESIPGRLTTIRAWRLRGADASILALAAGPHYVEAAMAVACEAGVEEAYAVGWCGSLRRSVGIGDVVVAYAAVRGEATSDAYAPPGYPAVADPRLAARLYEAVKAAGLRAHLGIVYTTASHLREERLPEEWGGLAHCVECEVSTFYVIASRIGLPAAAALVVSDSLVEARRDPRATHEATARLIEAILPLLARPR